MKMENVKNNVGAGLVPAQNGITLIALVITIIILLILAGIAISLTIGENGIINIAKQAGKNYANAEADEKRRLEDLYSSMLIATNEDAQINISVKDLKTFIKEQVQEELKENKSQNPTGTVISYMGNNVPAGYLSCNGKNYNIEEYKQLAEQIKSEFGSYNYFGGDGTTTFAVPDLRGEFLRGTGENNHQDGCDGATVGEHQDGSDVVGGYFGNSTGTLYVGESMFYTKMRAKSDNWMPYTGVVSKIRRSDTESLPYPDTIGKGTSRPTNTSVLYCIKY